MGTQLAILGAWLLANGSLPFNNLHTNVISGSYSVWYWAASNSTPGITINGIPSASWVMERYNSGPSFPLWLTNVYGGTNPVWTSVQFSWASGQFQKSPAEEYDFTWTLNGQRGTAHLTTNFYNLQVVRPLTNQITIRSSSPTMEVTSNLVSGPWLPVSTNYVILTGPLGNWFYRGSNVIITATNL